MKVAFCVPSTTNKRDWESAENTHLWSILCNSLEKYCPDHQIKLFVGYNTDDKIYSIQDERFKFNAVFKNFEIEFIPMEDNTKGKPTHIWNRLGEVAIEEGYKYFKLLGDDIKMPNDSGWLGCFINRLKKNNNIGWSAGWSNNNDIATQFLVHKTHYDLFGFFYPPAIDAWFCDNFLFQIYPEKYRTWLKSYPLLNLGGEPRYEPKDDSKLCQMLLHRYRPKLNRFLLSKNKVSN
jgi:hypothetical protein